MKKTALLKKLILDKDILIMPAAYDAVSSMIIEQVGFKATTISGHATSATMLGKPDLSLITLTEMANHTRNICEAVNIPVLVDGDTGHGGVLNVIRTVKEFEKAGAAGLFIEDQTFPKRCGHLEGKQVISTDEMVAKIKAAADAREDPDFIIQARTDALAVHGIEEAIDRANIYREAGADLLFVEAPTTKKEMIKVNKEVNGPTVAIQGEGGKTPLLGVMELEDMGYAVVVYPGSALYAAAWAVRGVMDELIRTGTTKGYMDRMHNFSSFNELMGLEKFLEKENSYLKELLK
ncbi:MAG: isocitrate lyase/phosphoenolpyruvate mutase family protein [Deltaproteobacteria bacterium]|nr:isocitrate lyase/phosphoenolpyruvate mutase family protein [Deltaproteobacteria bacterium]MBW2138603.1 isocitrate lyase/phosphoenolpyruvate mutase family protein [Deltaproteobacteria bacterium]